MVHSDKIHRWLSDPAGLSGAEKDTIAAMVEKYPYFIPGRYLEEALKQETAPFSNEMQSRMQLFVGNRLLWYEIMQKAAMQELDAAEPASGEPAAELPDMGTGDPLIDGIGRELRSEQEGLAGADDSRINAASPADVAAGSSATEDILSIPPVYAEDYFRHQGIKVPDGIPAGPAAAPSPDEKDKSLMVVMSFSEWLTFFKSKTEKEKEEEEGQRALRAMWQKEKMAAALEDENDEIPEEVFTMAVNSISREDDLASEPLAGILIRQGKYDKAIEMYRKLSLRNPQKSTYFAGLIEKIQKEKDL